MRKLIFTAAAAAILVALPQSASAVEFYTVFKASIMLPVIYVDPPAPAFATKAVTKTLAAKEFINLTLGRPLDTPLGTHILALVLSYEQPTQTGQPPPTPSSKLVVWDTALPGDNTVDKTVATIGELTELDFNNSFTATGAKGQGYAAAAIPEGTADVTGKNKFFAVTLRGAGIGTQAQSTQDVKFTLTGLRGRVHFKYTDAKFPAGKDVFGIAVKGSLTTAGKQIATFSY